MRVSIGLQMVVAGAALAVVAGCGGGSTAGGSAAGAAEPTGLIAFTHQNASGKDRIFVMRADGSGRRALTTKDSLDPVWSPDGTKLAYLDHEQHLVVMNADGTGSRVISRESGWLAEDEIASWSPSGKQLVFGAKLGPGADALSIVNADGTGRRRLGVRGLDPDWSPDGKSILFNDPTGLVAVIGVDGRGLRRLTHSGCSADLARWSPDGKQIAFTGAPECTGRAAIEVMNADGTGRHPVARGAGGSFDGLAWSADGTQIVYSVGPDLFTLGNLYVADVDGGGVRQITSDGGDFDPSWQHQSG